MFSACGIPTSPLPSSREDPSPAVEDDAEEFLWHVHPRQDGENTRGDENGDSMYSAVTPNFRETGMTPRNQTSDRDSCMQKEKLAR